PQSNFKTNRIAWHITLCLGAAVIDCPKSIRYPLLKLQSFMRGFAMSLKNLSLNKKLIGTFAALMSICMLASAGVFWQVLKSNQASAEQVRAQTILRHSENALEAMLKQVVDQRGFLLFADD